MAHGMSTDGFSRRQFIIRQASHVTMLGRPQTSLMKLHLILLPLNNLHLIPLRYASLTDTSISFPNMHDYHLKPCSRDQGPSEISGPIIPALRSTMEAKSDTGELIRFEYTIIPRSYPDKISCGSVPFHRLLKRKKISSLSL